MHPEVMMVLKTVQGFGLSYILYEDEEGALCVGFRRFNDAGYIDDGRGWSELERDTFSEFLYALMTDCLDPCEINTFTYAVLDEAALTQRMQDYGIPREEPGW